MEKEIVSAEYIGVVKAFAQECNSLVSYRSREWVYWQTASTIKGKDVFWTDDKLKQDDGLHPTSAGVAVIVQNIMPTVEELIARVQAKAKS